MKTSPYWINLVLAGALATTALSAGSNAVLDDMQEGEALARLMRRQVLAAEVAGVLRLEHDSKDSGMIPVAIHTLEGAAGFDVIYETLASDSDRAQTLVVQHREGLAPLYRLSRKVADDHGVLQEETVELAGEPVAAHDRGVESPRQPA